MQRFDEAAPWDTAGAFSGLKSSGDVAAALARVAGNKVTPAMQQMLTANSKGLGKNVGNVLAAIEGGRAPTQEQASAIEAASSPAAGDTPITILYKNIAVKEEMFTALSGHKARDPDVSAQQDKALAYFKTPVTSASIVKYVREHGTKEEASALARAQESVGGGLNAMRGVLNNEGQGAGAGAPPNLNTEQRALWNKYNQ